MKPAALRVERSSDGALVTLVIDGPPGNVVGAATAEALAAAVAGAEASEAARLVVLSGEGAHFSYGASVEEHLPGPAPRMLSAMKAAVMALVGCELPTLALVQGRCLGGGLELALSCGEAWAAEGSVLAVPEIRLGVFAPFASALLPVRVGRAVAEDWLLTGRHAPASEALGAGAVSRILPREELGAAVEARLQSLRPAAPRALRAAVRAARRQWAQSMQSQLDEMESLYRESLLAPGDEQAAGLQAFLSRGGRA